MAGQPVVGNTGWGATQNDFTGVTLEPTTGLVRNEALQTAATAPIADAALANKKYVDDISTGNIPTDKDSDSNTLLVGDGGLNVANHAYLAQTSGYATIYTSTTTTRGVTAYVGSTDDPEGAGIVVAKNQLDGSGFPFVSFFVPKGSYFEAIKDATSVIFRMKWTPLIAGGNPVDQD